MAIITPLPPPSPPSSSKKRKSSPQPSLDDWLIPSPRMKKKRRLRLIGWKERDDDEKAKEERRRRNGFEDCLKLIAKKRDEDRLEGLRLLPRFCKKDEKEKIRRVHDVISCRFLLRLFQFGMRDEGNNASMDERALCLRIYVTTLDLFCHVEELAENRGMVFWIPSIMKIMKRETSPRVLSLCYRILAHVSFRSEYGVSKILEAEGANIFAAQLTDFTSGSHKCALCVIGLMEIIFCDISQSALASKYLKELLTMVRSVARLIALLGNDHKFDLMYLLSFILPCSNLGPLRDALISEPNYELQTYLRAGIMHTFTNHTGTLKCASGFDKWSALLVVKSLVSMSGKIWLAGKVYTPDMISVISSGGFSSLILRQSKDDITSLVLRQSKVEITRLLGGLWHLDLQAESSKTLDILLKVKNLRVSISVVLKIIKFVSVFAEDYGACAHFARVNSDLKTIIELVLEYLADAKGGKRTKGYDLLESVVLVGSYFGDKFGEVVPSLQEKFLEVLDHMVSIEPDNDPRNYVAALSLLPTLSGIAKDSVLGLTLASQCYPAVVDLLVRLRWHGCWANDDDQIVSNASAILFDLLLRQKSADKFLEDASVFVPLLNVVAFWTEGAVARGYLVILMSCICTLILEVAPEDDLLGDPDTDKRTFRGLNVIIFRSMKLIEEGTPFAAKDYSLHEEIIANGYPRLVAKFPVLDPDDDE